MYAVVDQTKALFKEADNSKQAIAQDARGIRQYIISVVTLRRAA